jgi:predicted nucleic acid-binding protein
MPILKNRREYGISFLASNDADFERVPSITVFEPTDLP